MMEDKMFLLTRCINPNSKCPPVPWISVRKATGVADQHHRHCGDRLFDSKLFSLYFSPIRPPVLKLTSNISLMSHHQNDKKQTCRKQKVNVVTVKSDTLRVTRRGDATAAALAPAVQARPEIG